jgi:hypothetical protein
MFRFWTGLVNAGKREKSERGGELNRRQKRPEKARNKAREVGPIELRSQGIWVHSEHGETGKSVLHSGASSVQADTRKLCVACLSMRSFAIAGWDRISEGVS